MPGELLQTSRITTLMYSESFLSRYFNLPLFPTTCSRFSSVLIAFWFPPPPGDMWQIRGIWNEPLISVHCSNQGDTASYCQPSVTISKWRPICLFWLPAAYGGVFSHLSFSSHSNLSASYFICTRVSTRWKRERAMKGQSAISGFLLPLNWSYYLWVRINIAKLIQVDSCARGDEACSPCGPRRADKS